MAQLPLLTVAVTGWLRREIAQSVAMTVLQTVVKGSSRAMYKKGGLGHARCEGQGVLIDGGNGFVYRWRCVHTRTYLVALVFMCEAWLFITFAQLVLYIQVHM